MYVHPGPDVININQQNGSEDHALDIKPYGSPKLLVLLLVVSSILVLSRQMLLCRWHSLLQVLLSCWLCIVG